MTDDDSDQFEDQLLDDEEDIEDEQDDEEEKEDEIQEDEDDLYVEKESYTSHTIVKIIPKEKRRTSNRISLFEFVNVIGTRAESIEKGDEIYTSIENKETSLEIAEAEIREGRCPFIIERVLYRTGNTVYVEHWAVREMILPP